MHRQLLPLVSALAAAALLGCPGPGPEATVFEVTADSAAAFGAVVVNGQSQELTFTVKNAGGGSSGTIAISLEGINAAAFRVTTDGCSGTTLAGGATCPVGVTMSPRSSGNKSALLAARDSRGNGQLTISGSGVTRALLQVSPASFSFGVVPTGGSSADGTFTVTNTGSEPTGALAVALGGAGANQFTKPTDTCDGQSLGASATCTIKVRFAPSGLGAQAAAVTVTGAPGGALTIPVSGTGGTPAALAINPTSKDFGTVATGTQTADTTFTVTNAGSVNATNLTVALTGDSGEFVNSGGTCAGLLALVPAGGTGTTSCTVKVAFKPTRFGTRNLTVSVTGKVANSSATTQISVSPTGIGQQSFTVTVANSGTGSGTVAGGAINCGSACTTNVTAAATAGSITLTATPGAGSSFVGWTGDCAGNTGTTCTLTVDANKSAGAAFDIQRFSLTPVVSAAPGAAGSVTSTDGQISCTGASCPAVSYDYNTVVHLAAAASPGSRFTGWSGDCSGTGATCDVTMTQARAATANFEIAANYAFATSSAYTLSELALKVDPAGALNAANVVGGADLACGERAAAANLPGTYKAWIASTLGSATSRLGSARGWLRTDGLPFADQLPGDVFYPLQRDEAGAAVSAGAPVLTNTDLNGAAQGSCADFTNNIATTATTGSPGGGSTTWASQTSAQDCGANFQLFCLGTDNTATVSAPSAPAGARLVFASSGTFAPGVGGIAVAHALCQAEATAASLPGTYKAVLATNGATSASLFTTRGAPVVRPDNVVVAAADTSFFAEPEVLVAPPERTAAGAVAVGALWTGTTGAQTAGTDASSCTSWTLATGNGDIGSNAGTFQLYTLSSDACSTSQRLVCLQE